MPISRSGLHFFYVVESNDLVYLKPLKNMIALSFFLSCTGKYFTDQIRHHVTSCTGKYFTDQIRHHVT